MHFRLFFSFILANCLLAGGASAQRIDFDGSWGDPGFNLLSQSAEGVEFVFSLPSIRFGKHAVNSRNFDTVAFPGIACPNDPGAPDLPAAGRIFAFPQGAAYGVEIVASRTRTFTGIDILPGEQIRSIIDDSPPVFIEDPAIYTVDADYPASPVIVSDPRKMRGVDIFLLGVIPFAYNPVRKTLVVYTDLRVKVTFTGGNGLFGNDAFRSRWFEPMLRQNLVNYTSLPAIDFDARPVSERRGRSGECEYMIFVPDDPDFHHWAKKIKEFRVRQGITTGIFNVEDHGGIPAGIEAKIDDAYANWTLKPAAVLMLGDVPVMPCHKHSFYCSDNIYADVDGDDLPDLNVARIAANDAAELEVMIEKVIAHETSPPVNPSFYDNPVMAGGWQEDVWFILSAEIIWGFHDKVLGKNPVREYTGAGGPPSIWSTGPNTNLVVDYFGPTGLGYIPATPSHLTDWGGNATRINADLNSGAFYAVHSDHGYTQGWGHPSYTIPDLADLTNTDLFFVLSINCSTGEYDYLPECFAEAIYRLTNNGVPVGAVGVIAASAASYCYPNDVLNWGIHDALWPNFDPGYGGSTGDNPLMPGFAHVSGKWYLEASSWPHIPLTKKPTYHLFHLHGDAFLQLCDEVPGMLTVSHASSVASTATSFDVVADAGSLIAVAAHGEVLGTAVGTGGITTVAIDPPTDPGVMFVTVTALNRVRYEGEAVIQTGAPLVMWLPEGQPADAMPGLEVDVPVQIFDGTHLFAAGSGKVYYRFDPGDTFNAAPLTTLGVNDFVATIPGAPPGSAPEFYVSADHTGGGTVTSPPDAPTTTWSYGVRDLFKVFFAEDFETGQFEPCWSTQVSGAGRIQVTEFNGPIGNYHVTMDGTGTYVDGMAWMILQIDLSSLTEAILVFQFREWDDELDPEDAVSISEDGVIWHDILELHGVNEYAERTIDLAKAAAKVGISLTDTFRIKWTWADNCSIPTDGFGFDGIRIESVIQDPSLWAGAYSFSAEAGCDIPLYLAAGPAYAGRTYFILGGLSGSYPGFMLPGGKILPVNWDWLTDLILHYPNSYPFQDFMGNLDSKGEAVARFSLTPSVAVPCVGMTFTFAYTLFNPFDMVSSAVRIEITP